MKAIVQSMLRKGQISWGKSVAGMQSGQPCDIPKTANLRVIEALFSSEKAGAYVTL